LLYVRNPFFLICRSPYIKVMTIYECPNDHYSQREPGFCIIDNVELEARDIGPAKALLTIWLVNAMMYA
jgi:hypothetical protein